MTFLLLIVILYVVKFLNDYEKQTFSPYWFYQNRTRWHSPLIMRCFHPIAVKKYSEEKNKSGSHFKVNNYHLVPCGKCVACLARRRNEWTYRLTAEQACSDYTFFITLTYDDSNVPIRVHEGRPFFVFNKEHVQKYIKRVVFCKN